MDNELRQEDHRTKDLLEHIVFTVVPELWGHDTKVLAEVFITPSFQFLMLPVEGHQGHFLARILFS